jgi:predicted amidophosphoribosyltransferase
MTMKQSRIIDGDHDSENQLCGHALVGHDVGNCPDCKKRRALMASGYCATCAYKRGISVFNTLPNPAPNPDKEHGE